jgi:hypothetical protein
MEGKPYLKPITHPDGGPSGDKSAVPIGFLKGLTWISPDFDEPDQDVIDAFVGKYSNDEVVFEGFLTKSVPGEESPLPDRADQL